MVAIPPAGASPDIVVSLNPIEIVVSAPGQNFTVDVNVTDVVGLGAWEYKFTYNTTMLDATWVNKTSVTENCEYWRGDQSMRDCPSCRCGIGLRIRCFGCVASIPSHVCSCSGIR